MTWTVRWVHSLIYRRMNENLTVLVVSEGEPDERVIAALEQNRVFVERCRVPEFRAMLPLVAPELVVYLGASAAVELVRVLGDPDLVAPSHLAVVAEPGAQAGLGSLDRRLVVAVLSSEVPAAALAARLTTLARRLADQKATGAALRAPAAPAVAKPGAAPEAAQAQGAPRVALDRLRGAGASGRPAGPAVRVPPPKLRVAPKPAVALPTPTRPSERRTSSQRGVVPGFRAQTERSRWLRGGKARRAVVADDNRERALAIADALTERGLDVQVVPLDPAGTDWVRLQAHEPEVLIVDQESVEGARQVWLQLFQADAQLRSARLAKLNLQRVFDDATLHVSLAALEPYIEELASYRSEMPTIVADDERPTLVYDDGDDRPTLAMEENAPSRDAVVDFARVDDQVPPFGHEPSDAPDSEDGPTMAVQVPADLLAAARGGSSRGQAEASPGPPRVQLSESVIFEAKALEAAALPPAQQARPGSPDGGGPLATGATSSSPTAITVPPRTPAVPRVSGVTARSSAPPASSASSAAAPSSRPTSPAPSRPSSSGVGSPGRALLAQEQAEQRRRGARGLFAALGVLVLVGLGAVMVGGKASGEASSLQERLTGWFAAKPPAGTPPEPTAQEAAVPPADVPAPPREAVPEVSPWILPSGEAIPCEQLVQAPAAITGASIERGALAWDRARRSLVLGDMQAAQRHMCEAVLNNPHSLALEGLVSYYLSRHAPERALPWVEKALTIRGDSRKTGELHGDVLSQLGRAEEARQAWLGALRVAVDDEKTARMVAISYLGEYETARSAGDHPRAEAMARRAFGLDSRSAEAAAAVATAYLDQGFVDAARPWGERCQELAAADPSCLLFLGDLAKHTGDVATARRRYEQVAKVAPSDRRAWTRLSQLSPAR